MMRLIIYGGESNEGHSDELKKYLQPDCQNSHNQCDNEPSPHKRTESQALDANEKEYQASIFNLSFRQSKWKQIIVEVYQMFKICISSCLTHGKPFKIIG